MSDTHHASVLSGQSLGREIDDGTVIYFFREDKPHHSTDVKKYEKFHPTRGIYKNRCCPACAMCQPASESRIYELLPTQKKKLFVCVKGHRFTGGCWRETPKCKMEEAGLLLQQRKILQWKKQTRAFNWKSFCMSCCNSKPWASCPDCNGRLSDDSLRRTPCKIPVRTLSKLPAAKGMGYSRCMRNFIT